MGVSMIPTVDIGFVFALRQESVGILDRLKNLRKTRGNGRVFYTGKMDAGTIGSLSIALVHSGVGQKNAEEATKILIDVFAPQAVCSAGYAGGLSPRLKRFTICVPEQILRKSDCQTLDVSVPIPKITPQMPEKLTLLTVNDVVELPAQKRILHEQTGAELVDMETFAVADVCRCCGVPFFSFRVILDAIDDRIPRDIACILKHAGVSTLRLSGAVLGSVCLRPSAVLDLFSLKRRAYAAAERLAQFTLREFSRRETAACRALTTEPKMPKGSDGEQD